ncbi:MFS transporter [Streptomyces sp. ISL-100]|uniref:MFS transporter n=1 Tax=Streptomyces sp. ISL-100 TaxID=2819173 RepID=UPI001BE9C38B|nr:MFS transporter [Streptomyces sp. ISL-100]MBT2396906.1 MFS transporter [Streptomyces sp. ISL-100]
MTTMLAGAPPHGARPAAYRRTERLLLPAVFVTNLGNNIQLIASSLLIYKDLGTTLSVGWVYVLVALPQVLLSVLFGRWADRFDRRTLCVVTDILSTLTAAFLPLWLLFGGDGSSAAYGVNLVLAVLSALFMPASLALVKERVPEERLGNFNANYEFAFQGGTMLSGVLGGFAVQFFGATPLFLFNALTFAASALLLFSLGRKPAATATAGAAAEREPTDGSSTGSAEPATETVPEPATPAAPAGPVLRLGLLFSVGSVIVTVANTLLLVVVIDRFHKGAATLGIADALACTGMLAGIALYKRIKDRVDYRLLILAGYGICAGLAFIQPYALATLLPGVFLAGMTFVFGRLPSRTELMRNVADERSGRVFGAANGFGLALSLVLTLVVAYVCDRFGIIQGYATLAAFGTLATVVCVGSLYVRPHSLRSTTGAVAKGSTS